ncbi:MAG: TolC family protein, partial [Prevotellaceae bacterium]|jgi:outer membrane protein TolC|nr:TolC family protein [Prevotellaceae bacterium]
LNISTEEAIVYGRQNNPTLLGLRQSILEAEQTVDRTKKESYFNATFDASIGFNQVSETLGGVYRSPMQQDLVSISMSIPLIDWGVRKGQYNMARNNLNIARITATQNEISIEEDILMTVNDFQMQQKLIISAQEALDLAAMVYEQVREQFIIGRVDISNLTLSMTRQQTAQQNYIAAMQQYWQNYYKIRRLTLYDFENRMPLADKFDYDGGNLTR